MNTNKIAFLPGTFNPIHKAHIDIAKRAKSQYGFNKVIFVTYNNQPHKHNWELPSVQDRFNMIHLAIKPYNFMDVLGIEFKEGGVTDFHSLVRTLQKIYKQKRLNILISDDSFLQGAVNWSNLRDIYNNVRFFVNPRYNYINIIERNPTDKMLYSIVKSTKKFMGYIWQDIFNLSSTEIRSGLDAKVVKKVLPKGTKRYLEETDVYNTVKTPQTFNLFKHLTEDTAERDQVFDDLPLLKKYPQISVSKAYKPDVQKIIMKDPVKL